MNKIYKVEAPDGSIIQIEGPVNASQEQVLQAAQAAFAQRQAPASTPTQQPMTLPAQQPGFLDRLHRILMKYIRNSSRVQTVFGGLRGAGSIGATLLTPYDMAVGNTQSWHNPERRQAIDGGLRELGANPESMSYRAGKLATEVAGTAGAGGALAMGLRALPVIGSMPAVQGLVQALRTGGMAGPNISTRVAGGAASSGLAAGMIDPTQAGQGVVVGWAIPGATAVAGHTGRALGRAMRPSTELAQIAQKAQQYDIPIGLGDVSENRMLQGARSMLRDAPLTGGMAAGAQEAKQEAFNRAVGRTFGADAPKLTTEVVDQAKQRMGAEFDRIWNQNNLQITPEFAGRLAELKQLSAKLPRNEGQSLAAEIDDLATRVVNLEDGSQVIPGQVANKFQQYLRRRAESSAGLRNELGDMRGAIIDAFNKSVSPEDAAALTMNRAQYRAFKTVEPLLRGAELGVAGRMPGDVPASMLPGAVARSYSRTAGEPLADLAQVGSRFLVDRTPQTGGSARAALQNTAIGGALAGGLYLTPMTLAAIPTAIGLQSALNSPALARAAMGQGSPVSPALLNALRATQAAAPVLSAQ